QRSSPVRFSTGQVRPFCFPPLSVLLLGTVEVRGRVAGQVGTEERGRLRQRDAEVGLPPHPDAELPARAAEQVAAELPVVGQEMEVVAGYQDRPEVAGRPEADEGAADPAHAELLLAGSRLDEGYAFRRRPDRPGVDGVERAV